MKKLVKTAFFIPLVSSMRSCLLNELKSASKFRAIGSIKSLVYFSMVDTALRTSRRVGRGSTESLSTSSPPFMSMFSRAVIFRVIDTAVAELFWRGCKILQQDVRILPSHFIVTCYPYKEVHVTAKCDGKILTTCLLFCTPSKIVRPRQ